MSSSAPAFRVLYLFPDSMGPRPSPERNAVTFLARHLELDFVFVWYYDDEREAHRRVARLREAAPSLSLHWLKGGRWPRAVRPFLEVLYYIRTGLSLARRRRAYDVIVAYGPFRTAIAGVALKWLLRAPLIVELPGNPLKSYRYSEGRLRRLKARLAPSIAATTVHLADHVRLLYPSQLQGWSRVPQERTSVFHDFVPVHTVPEASAGNYILFLGYPWKLKGVDVLIRAFREIQSDYPDISLRIIGHCPDRRPFLELSRGLPNVEFLPGIPHEEAILQIAGCRLLVLPSRTEGMGRVLVEAMAARRPVVASRVDGIPYYVQDGRTGLLFESENASELAACLRKLLSDPAYASELADRGWHQARTVYSEQRYTAAFIGMIEAVVARTRRGSPPAR